MCSQRRPMMSVTTGLASLISAVEFLLGSIVGLAVAAVIFRAGLTIRLAVSAMFCAGAVFLSASWIAGWADVSTSFVGDHTVATAPWAYCPRFASCLADNRLVLCITSSVITAAIASLYSTGRLARSRITNRSS